MNKSSDQEGELNNEKLGAWGSRPSIQVAYKAEDNSGEANLNFAK